MRIVHCKKSPHDVYIGRPSKWGNPFAIGRDGTRDKVIEKFREWGEATGLDIAAKRELRGKVLGCWCAPKRCHGEVLVEWADAPDPFDVVFPHQRVAQQETPQTDESYELPTIARDPLPYWKNKT